MDPLTKPDHLSPPGRWWPAHAAGAIALGLGILAFVIVAVTNAHVWETPDWRISVPCFAATAAASIVSLARRERGAYPLWGLGLGLAAAALVLGWVLMLAVVVGATALLILILHSVL